MALTIMNNSDLHVRYEHKVKILKYAYSVIQVNKKCNRIALYLCSNDYERALRCLNIYKTAYPEWTNISYHIINNNGELIAS